MSKNNKYSWKLSDIKIVNQEKNKVNIPKLKELLKKTKKSLFFN